MPPFTLIGEGRIGGAIYDMGGCQDFIVKRGKPVEGPPGPIIVCTRNDQLQNVVDATPEHRREDLVFIQNGMLQPWLDERGLGNNTQVLVYFAVAVKGESPIDGKIPPVTRSGRVLPGLEPMGLTAAKGKHAQAFAERLHAGKLACRVMEDAEYNVCMLEKLIWICAFMLIGAKYNCNIGHVSYDHTDEVKELVEELGRGGAEALGVQLDGGLVPRLMLYSAAVAGFPTAVKEFEWRNGWFYDQTKAALKEGRPDPYPLHTAALAAVAGFPTAVKEVRFAAKRRPVKSDATQKAFRRPIENEVAMGQQRPDSLPWHLSWNLEDRVRANKYMDERNNVLLDPNFLPKLEEFEWRNGWFYDQTKAALKEGRPDPYPLHTAALKAVNAIQDEE
eukprot:CAMPEP_0206148900 /NCGR_PEP_ID=MMETSP1473-20131121/37492_1 /ASSEMBLY_ACC=CAM_ASM_001109 /TAXON_ID=1461547 /ORGANISM="Stichococcus sp, Strain RCC1054" /LENGTH=389 /DNA_ID=CAMNT_0053546333 /DNA_START=329 /DNA_END=1499 /DNA_ORIENTATION=+